MNLIWLDAIIRRALEEDIGYGDLTTEAIAAGRQASGAIRAKAPGRIAGIEVATRTFLALSDQVQCEVVAPDGTDVQPGDVVLRLQGPAGPILSGERVALNFLQRLSGIATVTAKAVAETAGTRARIADTRKTTPTLRPLEKYAVRVGGGINHRMGLDDAVLIKENHIAVAGGIAAAVAAVRQRIGHLVKVEVEVERLDQIEEALAAGVDAILLDNMSTDQLRQAVRITDGRAILEASGGLRPGEIAAVAATGVDVISIGWLTHSAPALDLSLRLDLR